MIFSQVFFPDTDSFYLQVEDYSWEETVLALKEKIDFSNLPPEHTIFKEIDYKKYASDRKHQFSFLKIDTAENVIHAFLGQRRKSYNLFLSKNPESVFDISETSLDRKDVKGGCPASAAKKLSTKDLLGLINKPGIVKAKFQKLQSKNHMISMIQQEKMVSNSFDGSAFYKDCNMCNVPFDCNPKIKKCKSVDCEKNRLFVKLWHRKFK